MPFSCGYATFIIDTSYVGLSPCPDNMAIHKNVKISHRKTGYDVIYICDFETSCTIVSKWNYCIEIYFKKYAIFLLNILTCPQQYPF